MIEEREEEGEVVGRPVVVVRAAAEVSAGDKVKRDILGGRAGVLRGRRGGAEKEFGLEVDADHLLSEQMAGKEEDEVSLELCGDEASHATRELSGKSCCAILAVTLTGRGDRETEQGCQHRLQVRQERRRGVLVGQKLEKQVDHHKNSLPLGGE